MPAPRPGPGAALPLARCTRLQRAKGMGRDVVDFNADDTSVTNTGQAVLAIDIAAFGDPAEFRRSVDALSRDLRGSKRLPGVDRIWLPGEQSWLTRLKREVEGVPIPPALRTQLDALARDLVAKPLAA